MPPNCTASMLSPGRGLWQIQGNPVKQNVDAGVASYHDSGCDGVVAFGGGSALDAAKVTRCLSTVLSSER